MSENLLQHIVSPTDLRKLEIPQLPQVAKELRDFIIDVVSKKEGHLGASLGVVELTIALHYVFNTPEDLLVWDVGHQAYGHKILTERKEKFHTNRQLGGISGFPKRSESIYDTFGVGHSSTSISAALGMAIASQLKGENNHHIAVIGDASIASGMAFEGLNHAGVTDADLLVILNDNAIGIDPSVGALKNYLTAVKEGKNPKQNNMIKSLNFDYSGPIDGHDIEGLIQELERLKKVKGPKFLHIITTKGKGLQQAEDDQVKYHAPGKFDAATGELIKSSTENESLTIQGNKENFLCSKAGGTNVCTIGIFTIEITFKDGKFKFDALSLSEKPNNATTITAHNLDDFSEYYDKDGSLKKYKDDVPAAYESLFNDLNKSLIAFMDKKKKAENW
jgi:1-deoxy-D-xylulose-5-phosphate synthase